ncbi:uncharacterized protein DFL_000863 [Arthrobotrys flagrans]|uniref:Uncharacterized protein n=1 Tax=Arthrobotrys flagrans TaxID=97331 RepID=A0A437AF30_ARTFL|nr:hypothetical protein DFL_000863 [Arthrobotrys flagrans]
MPFFKRSKDLKSPSLGLSCIPLSPNSSKLCGSPGGVSDVSRTSIVSVSTSTCDWLRSERACIANSKSDILGHALHLARLAAILDKAQVYIGAARAYFDCCYVLSTIEPELGPVELEITNQISRTYKQRLAYLSARVTISGRSSLSFPSHMIPSQEFQIDLSSDSKQAPRLVELNRICQFLRTLGHCCEVIQEIRTQDESSSRSGAEALLGLSSELQKLRVDISKFREFYSNQQLATGEAGNILFVLLGSYKRKVDDIIKGENKKLLVFLLSLFDLKLPAECEAEIKPLPPQPLQFKKPSFQTSTGNYTATPDSAVSPLSMSAGPSVKYATTILGDEREPIQLASAPIPKKSAKRSNELGKGKEKLTRSIVTSSPEIGGIDERMEELMKGGSFLLV